MASTRTTTSPPVPDRPLRRLFGRPDRGDESRQQSRRERRGESSGESREEWEKWEREWEREREVEREGERKPGVEPPPAAPKRAQGGAPNVLMILLDGAGFGAPGAFGGPVRTPTADRLAADGLRYTRFHTAAQGAPARASLLTGRNHHAAGAPAAPLAEILRRNGYGTALFGTCHEERQEARQGAAVPRGPAFGGFEYRHGCGGPGGRPVSDLADATVAYLRRRPADTPFFVCFAPDAGRARRHVPEELVHGNRGRFDDGWDALRRATFARQQALGVIGPDAALTPRPGAIPAWDDIAEERKPDLRRRMEAAAAALEDADRQAGRVVDALDEAGLLADTLVLYLVGAPDEGGDHRADGWAHALCTPFQWSRLGASYYGGTRNAAVVHWPQGIEERGGLRHQWHHAIDVAPTILELAGATTPDTVGSVPQAPMHGTSLAYTFNEPDAAERRHTQHFELMGDRAVYDRGWTAVTRHRDVPGADGDFSEDAWELYDTRTDWTQARDLSGEHPEKLAEMQLRFITEASRFDVFPREGGAGSLAPVRGDSLRLYPGTDRLHGNAAVDTLNRSFTVTAAIGVPEGGAEGVLAAQGGPAGGWVLMLDGGRPAFHYNFCGLERYTVTAPAPVPAGEHRVCAEFHYDGGGIGKGGELRLSVDGAEAARGRVERTHPLYFSLDEGLDVGRDTAMPVYDHYAVPDGVLTGTLSWVQIDLGESGHDAGAARDVRLAAAQRHR